MDVTPLLERANLLLEQGRHKDAEKQVMQALQQEPNNDYALSILARCYMNEGRHDAFGNITFNARRPQHCS